MALIGRIIVIIFAVMVASLAAGMAIAMGVLGPAWHGLTGVIGERVVFWGATFVGASFAGAVGLLKRRARGGERGRAATGASPPRPPGSG